MLKVLGGLLSELERPNCELLNVWASGTRPTCGGPKWAGSSKWLCSAASLSTARLMARACAGSSQKPLLMSGAVSAYQDFIRVEGWIGNLAIMIENEFFAIKGPSANYQDRWGREGPTIRGLTVEQHFRRFREELRPLAERCGRVMREALAALEALRAVPSQAVERSKPIKVSLMFGQREEAPPTVVNT